MLRKEYSPEQINHNLSEAEVVCPGEPRLPMPAESWRRLSAGYTGRLVSHVQSSGINLLTVKMKLDWKPMLSRWPTSMEGMAAAESLSPPVSQLAAEGRRLLANEHGICRSRG